MVGGSLSLHVGVEVTDRTTDNQQQEFQELKKKSLSGMTALFIRQVLVKLIFFGGNIVLARLLAPQVFGIYAIVNFVVTFFSTFGDVGIGAALIQKKGELSREELSTTFWLQQMLVWSVVAVAVLAAPLALRVYPTLPPVGVWLIRAMALSFFFSSLKTIPAILMEREIDFNRIAWVDITENLAFQGVAITGAFLGWEAWSFVAAAVTRGFLGALLIYSLSSWRPSLHYRFESVKGLVRFGLPYQGNQILSFIKDAVTPLFVGAYAGAAAVGYLNWARNFAFVPLVISETFGRVAFPAFSQLQDDRELLGHTIENSIRMMTFVMLPVTGIFIALGPEITHYFYTDKWFPAINAFYLFSWAPLMMGVTLPMFSGILSIGKSKIILAMSLALIGIEWGIGAPLVTRIGFTGVAVTQPISYIIFTVVYKHVLRRQRVRVNVVRNAYLNLLIAALMAAIVWYAKGGLVTSLPALVAFAGMGLVVYLLLSFMLNRGTLKESLRYFRKLREPTC
ncbi:polysaccharide biosynthesis protein [Geobacter metallireducens RCH3]|nr:polysaccharide biosynthesis protein [Geobacter metallireducens RCH3]